MTDLEEICSTTVAYMVRDFDATHNMAYVYKVLETDAPYIAEHLHTKAPDLPYNTCLLAAIETASHMFSDSIHT